MRATAKTMAAREREMQDLNYHHLLYFYTVAEEGSIVKAAETLFLAPSTISSQVRTLEDSLGCELFDRSGRGLVLTTMGHKVHGYAGEIFNLGRELLDTVHNRAIDQPLRLHVGVSDMMPKLVAQRLLEPALQIEQEVSLRCTEDDADHLLARLVLHELDVVLVDAPLGAGSNIKAYSHLLGDCEIAVYGRPELIAAYQEDFPACLADAPFLLPTRSTTLRRAIDAWFASHDLEPRIVGEFEDSALMKVFGQSGAGLFPAPGIVRDALSRQYEVEVLCELEDYREQFFAISADRHIEHPAVVAITRAAQQTFF